MEHAPQLAGLKHFNRGYPDAHVTVRLGSLFLFAGEAVTELYEVAVMSGVPFTPMSCAPAIAAALVEAWSARWAAKR